MSHAQKPLTFEEMFRRDQRESDPPANWLSRRGSKFYVRSGDYTLMLTTPNGPIYAAYLFAGRAVEDGALHRLDNFIEVDECGRFDDDSIILKRETSRFLKNKLGIGEPLLTSMIAIEINPWEF